MIERHVTEGYDLYKKLASIIFDAPEEEITKDQRFMTKTLVWNWAFSIRPTTETMQKKYDKVVKELEKMRTES